MLLNRQPWILFAAAVLLASCSAKPASPPSSAQVPSSAPSGTSSKTQPAASGADATLPAGAAVKPSDSAQPETPKTNPPQAAEAETPKEVRKLYAMNPKTYDILPIDPAETDKKAVLLTFDDGPKDLEMNQGLLDTLNKHKAKAIFFMNGYRIKQKPELVKLVASRGMAIGNHSWDHDDLSKMSKDKIDKQIGDVQAIVKELTGKAPEFFRPPFGSGNADVRSKVKEENMLYMTWSNGSKDWEMTVKNNHPEQVVSNVLEQLRPGSNILMHELPWTVQALDELLTKLEEKGYRFIDPASIEIKP
ncbi:polysaccharide deacetylase family protein [Paenibacillus filicis]|uniref:Polysaccharide deacetylase family protein n=1 Tax=Paenibacillus gyeongsangnamensis TaxID=3388067 RepID=A0ABT4Q7Q6_9BACL|nr:polysaccharide deacetylase family protein [Paenibacillus filicis]MCZ8512906.1 polysaccharide deacetylase family protein [Paenibacillus filicis]